MKFLLILLTLCLASVATAQVISSFAAQGATTTGFHNVTRSQVSYVPLVGNFSLDNCLPALASHNAPLFKIHLTFHRGGSSPDSRFGGQGFSDLDCQYNRTNFLGCFAGSSTVADPFFKAGGKVFFVSGVKLWLELSRGNLVTISVDITRFIFNVGYSDTFNDQTIIIDRITNDWLTRNYFDIAQFYTPDIVFSVNIEAFKYVGIPTVIAYFLLGDPSVSDAFETLAIELDRSISSGNLAMVNYNETIKSLQLPEGQNIYWDQQGQEVLFEEHNLIYSHRLYVDGSKIIMFYPQDTNPNITKTCQVIQQYCTGNLLQFPNMSSCQAFMGTLPLLTNGFSAQSIGTNDVGCRSFHSSLIPGLPSVHCWHAGPFNAAILGGQAGLLQTPCIDSTGPATPLPSYYPGPGGSSRHVMRDVSSSYLYACDSSSPLCKYQILPQQTQNVMPFQISLSQRHQALIPAAGSLLQRCITSGQC